MYSPTLLLASNSPRRKELLAQTGLSFTVRPADIDESQRPGELPADYVLRLAESKARASAHAAEEGQWVLAADTIVVDGQDLLGKPADAAEARAMLERLRDRTHQVYTAIALLDPEDGRLMTDLCVADVTMRDYTPAEVEVYIASGDPFDKAGAYAIQNQSFAPVANFDGCYACVVGLPLCHLMRALRSFGLPSDGNAADICLGQFQYDCPIWRFFRPEEPFGAV